MAPVHPRPRARSDWRDMDLILLAKIVKMEADIRAAQIELDAMGMMVENKRGTPIPNPLLPVYIRWNVVSWRSFDQCR